MPKKFLKPIRLVTNPSVPPGFHDRAQIVKLSIFMIFICCKAMRLPKWIVVHYKVFTVMLLMKHTSQSTVYHRRYHYDIIPLQTKQAQVMYLLKPKR